MRCAGRPLSFNPRARVGRDYAEKDERNWSYMFQSTRPRGARPGIKYNGVEIFYVSIHAPAWGATLNGLIGYRCSGSFNPRARVGRDRMIGMICFSPAVFQSTRPRGARLFARLSWSPSLHVSIHAPAWGATKAVLLLSSLPHVSIHAPAWGATSSLPKPPGYAIVSIHAPAWGAT